MNNKYKHLRLLSISLLVLVAPAFLMTGCGPQDVNDPEYLSQLAELGLVDEAGVLNKDGDDASQAADEDGCPTGTCSPTPDPDTHRRVQLPDIHKTEPTNIMETDERQDSTDTIDYHQTTHVQQPSQTNHTVTQHRHLIKRFFPKTVNHPSHRKVIKVVKTSSQEEQTMPVEEVTEPLIDHGCQGIREEEAPAPVVSTVSAAVLPYPSYYTTNRFALYR